MDPNAKANFQAKLAQRRAATAALACVEKLAQLLKCNANPEAVLQAVEALQDTPVTTPEAAFNLVIKAVTAKMKGIDGADKVLADLVEARARILEILRMEPAEFAQAANHFEDVLAEVKDDLAARGWVKCPNCGQMNKQYATGCYNCQAPLRSADFEVPGNLEVWPCLVCGFMNKQGDRVCNRCDKPKGTPAPVRFELPLPPFDEEEEKKKRKPPIAPTMPVITKPAPPPAAPSTAKMAEGTWKCKCGVEDNTGKFCHGCGNPPVTTSQPPAIYEEREEYQPQKLVRTARTVAANGVTKKTGRLA